jgi:hypothetical protein
VAIVAHAISCQAFDHVVIVACQPELLHKKIFSDS